MDALRTSRLRASALGVIALALLVACDADLPTAPARPAETESLADLQIRNAWLWNRLGWRGVVATGEAPVLVGAGDIGDCTMDGDELTAELLDQIDGTVFTAGDNAYPNGSPRDFIQCYHPSWGRHYSRTYPTPGNHEYLTPLAAGYFWYFRARAGVPGFGFYSYDVGEWHVVALNSMLEYADPAVQRAWLTQDLTTHRNRCTIAYFHHPRFSSGLHQNQLQMTVLWEILYRFGAEIVVSGHDHDYERFAPQTPEGFRDDEFGIREFVVGTGGTSLRPFAAIQPNSEVRYNDSHAVLALTLRSGEYGWRLLRAPDGAVIDQGQDDCHDLPLPAIPG